MTNGITSPATTGVTTGVTSNVTTGVTSSVPVTVPDQPSVEHTTVALVASPDDLPALARRAADQRLLARSAHRQAPGRAPRPPGPDGATAGR